MLSACQVSMLCSVYKVYTVVKGQNQNMHEIEMSMHYFEIIRPAEGKGPFK